MVLLTVAEVVMFAQYALLGARNSKEKSFCSIACCSVRSQKGYGDRGRGWRAGYGFGGTYTNVSIYWFNWLYSLTISFVTHQLRAACRWGVAVLVPSLVQVLNAGRYSISEHKYSTQAADWRSKRLRFVVYQYSIRKIQRGIVNVVLIWIISMNRVYLCGTY